jgi:hypothetical protein
MDISKEWMKKDYLKNFNWIPTGRRKRGRPRTRGKEGVFRAMEESDVRDGNWENRLLWRYIYIYILDFFVQV